MKNIYRITIILNNITRRYNISSTVHRIKRASCITRISTNKINSALQIKDRFISQCITDHTMLPQEIDTAQLCWSCVGI